MTEIGIRALKQNTSAVVAKAEGGETITITDRGRPVALLSPIPESPLQALIASGRARPAQRSLLDLGPAPEGAALTPELLRQRDAERY